MLFRAFLMPVRSAPAKSESFRRVTVASWDSAEAGHNGPEMTLKSSAMRRAVKGILFMFVPRGSAPGWDLVTGPTIRRLNCCSLKNILKKCKGHSINGTDILSVFREFRCHGTMARRRTGGRGWKSESWRW